MKSRNAKRPSQKSTANNGSGPEVFVHVSDELYDDLLEFAGQKVMSFSLWDDSLTDALEEGILHPGSAGNAGNEPEKSSPSPDAEMFDLDLYLEGGLYFELYGTSFFPQIDTDPLVGSTLVHETLSAMVSDGVWLDEVAVDENEQLVLILNQQHQPVLYLPIGGWVVEEWDELPD